MGGQKEPAQDADAARQMGRAENDQEGGVLLGKLQEGLVVAPLLL
jgi:hypothetical protein